MIDHRDESSFLCRDTAIIPPDGTEANLAIFDAAREGGSRNDAAGSIEGKIPLAPAIPPVSQPENRQLFSE
jgi:hypothetical protein